MINSNKLCWYRYNRMMLYKVKPLHDKVEQTSAAIENAEHRMRVLQTKHEVNWLRIIQKNLFR